MQGPERLAREHEEADGRCGRHGRRSRGDVPEERDLAEEVARPEVCDLLAAFVTATSPSTMTKNSWPISPSRASTLPAVDLEVLGDLRELGQLVPRQVPERAARAERRRLVVVREELHARNLTHRGAPLPTASQQLARQRRGGCAAPSTRRRARPRCVPPLPARRPGRSRSPPSPRRLRDPASRASPVARISVPPGPTPDSSQT